MDPRYFETPTDEVDPMVFENEDVRTMRLRPHLAETLDSLHDNGELKTPINQSSQASQISSRSVSSSHISTSDRGHSSSIEPRHEPPATPMINGENPGDTTSTANATRGSARKVRDSDDAPFRWGQNDVERLQAIEAHGERHKEQEEHAAAHETRMQSSNRPTAIKQTRRYILLTLLGFGIAIHMIRLARHRAATLKET
ncbi:hypothetical protein FKW77_010770 [Venturia effusa]|uniref:Uncharacterized protein n=1 Tax=Venturia effusa TaxID=50376 RepID=A0A517KYF4_9PEZI|nr:hypothetical protein FKW77_010770 [Venturia effusa]